LAFDGVLTLVSDAASIALAGSSFTSSLTLAAGAAHLALAGASDAATGVLQLLSPAAVLSLHADAAITGVLTLKAGSANAPLLHTIAPVAAPPVWQGLAVNLTATRTRAGGQAVARLVLRTAEGAPLPAEPLPAGVARVTLQRAGSLTAVETAGSFEAV